MKFRPYCTHCGCVLPEGINTTCCRPCAKKGHNYNLVMDEGDRQRRIKLWSDFHAKMGYTPAEVKNIPSFQRLLNVPAEAILESTEG